MVGRNEAKLLGTLLGATAWSVSLAVQGTLAPSLRLAAAEDERRNNVKETGDVEEVPNKRNELRADQPDVTRASDKEIRLSANGERAPEIEKEKQGNKHPNVEQLIGLGARVKGSIGIVAPFRHPRTNQSHVIDEKQPNDSRISCAQLKPRQGTIEPAEKNGLTKRASDVEKVMPEFEWPFNQGERVNDGPRPENKDHAQSSGDIEKGVPISR